MAKKLLLSTDSGAIITGTIGDVVDQAGKGITVFATATSWGTLSRIIIEASIDNGVTWSTCKDKITGDEIVISENIVVQMQELGKDVYLRARATQIIGVPTDVNIYINEVWA